MLLPELLDPSRWSVERRATVEADDLWRDGESRIIEADELSATPSFYPLYRLGNAYCHSPLGLIARAGGLQLDRDVARRIGRGDARYWSGRETLDTRVLRVGAPRVSALTLQDADTFVARFTDALVVDVAAAESVHAGHTNVVLCGGRDSLNLLLLPWQHPVIALSAAPNFALVRRFVEENGLDIPVRELRDEDQSLLETEVIANLCRLDLRHCRWAGELRAIAKELERRVVFWKGQLGDTFLTPYWRTYTHPAKARRIVRLPGLRSLTAHPLYQAYFWWSHFHRGAMWQGTHLSVLRDLTDALFLSAYHGPAVSSVLAEVDLAAAVREDVRPQIGARLAGRAVKYPESNPGPAPSSFRRGISGVGHFLEVAARKGLRVS